MIAAFDKFNIAAYESNKTVLFDEIRPSSEKYEIMNKTLTRVAIKTEETQKIKKENLEARKKKQKENLQ